MYEDNPFPLKFLNSGEVVKHAGRLDHTAPVRAQGDTHGGDHRGGVCDVLAAVLHRSAGAAFLRGELLHARSADGSHQLAGLLQLPPEPHHLRVLQQGLPERFQENHEVQISQTLTRHAGMHNERSVFVFFAFTLYGLNKDRKTARKCVSNMKKQKTKTKKRIYKDNHVTELDG